MECEKTRQRRIKSVLVVAIGYFCERGYHCLLQQIVLMLVTGTDRREKAVRLVEMAVAMAMVTVARDGGRERLDLDADIGIAKAVIVDVQRWSGGSAFGERFDLDVADD